MSLALEILDRRGGMSGNESQICDSNNADELFAYLQHAFEGGVDGDEEGDNVGELADCYVQRLEETIKLGQVQYKSNTKKDIGDAVELNILIEKSLLEYELRLAQNKNNNDDKKYVFDSNRLEYLLEHEDVEGSDVGLLRHYVELLKLGYAPDLNGGKNPSGSGGNGNENSHLMDELVSTLLSLAVQKNVHLPDVDVGRVKSLDGRIEWFKECIYKVASSGGVYDVPITLAEATDRSDSDDDRRALKDLQFAHSYLTKKYEEEVLQHGQYVSDVVSKHKHCEELLNQTSMELAKAASQRVKLAMENAELQAQLDARTSEVHELQMASNLLRVECLGHASASSLMSATPSSPPSSEGHHLVNSGGPSTPDSVSVRILRAEFKKLVEQMNERFAREIGEERRRLGGGGKSSS